MRIIPTGVPARRAAALSLMTMTMLSVVCAVPRRASAQAAPGFPQQAPGALAPLQYPRPTGTFVMPDFPPGLTWFNVRQPLSMQSLRGKMVLLDFWTYG
ncbi:MAG: hypothetical protein LC772_00695 [Chloroflexi bacterium]|nr:hypothetical protein [Chloroflexota bacterium]